MVICLIGTNTISFSDDVDFSTLKQYGELRLYPGLSAEETIANCRDADILLVNKTDLCAKVIESLPRLKYIGLYSTGYNNVDLEACKKRNIVVCNTPDYSTDAVAQHAIALLLAGAGSLVDYVNSVARGDWEKCSGFSYYDYPMVEVKGKTLGIFGLGNIGKRVAEIGAALGMEILVCTRTHRSGCPWNYVTKEELFARADFLSLHCPQNAETTGLVNAETLALMKPSAILINTARGGLIDEQALADALNGGRLAGAFLDVVSEEPVRSDNPLLHAKNCRLTPHIAWQPRETRLRLHRRVEEHLAAFFRGTPYDVVNVSRGETFARKQSARPLKTPEKRETGVHTEFSENNPSL